MKAAMMSGMLLIGLLAMAQGTRELQQYGGSGSMGRVAQSTPATTLSGGGGGNAGNAVSSGPSTDTSGSGNGGNGSGNGGGEQQQTPTLIKKGLGSTNVYGGVGGGGFGR